MKTIVLERKMKEEIPSGVTPYEFNVMKEKMSIDPSSEFSKGLRSYLKKDYSRALHLFKFGFSRKEIKEMKYADPYLVGFYGMLLAKVERNFYQSKQYGAIAMENGRDLPEVILIQAQIYELCNEPESALDTYREGLRKYPDNKEFLRKLQKLNPRRKRPVKFLPRESIINKTLGLIISRGHQFFARAASK